MTDPDRGDGRDLMLTEAATAIVRAALEDPQLARVAQDMARTLNAEYGDAFAAEPGVRTVVLEMARWLREWIGTPIPDVPPIVVKLCKPILRGCDWMELGAEYIAYARANPEPAPAP